MAVHLDLFSFEGRITPIFAKLGCTHCLRSIEKLNELAVKIRARDLVVLVEICKSYTMIFFPSACGMRICIH